MSSVERKPWQFVGIKGQPTPGVVGLVCRNRTLKEQARAAGVIAYYKDDVALLLAARSRELHQINAARPQGRVGGTVGYGKRLLISASETSLLAENVSRPITKGAR